MSDKDSGLVLHYAFDEGDGLVVHDRSGHGNHGTIKGQAEWVEKDSCWALGFNGKDTQIECSPGSGLELSQTGSLAVWCLPQSLQGGLVSWGTELAPDPSTAAFRERRFLDNRLALGFMQTPYYGSGVTGIISNGKSACGGIGEPWRFNITVEPNWRCHLVFTFDGSRMRLYQNGREMTWAPQHGEAEVVNVPMRIGVVQGLGEPYFDGLISEVRVYNRAISAEEVVRQYEQSAGSVTVENHTQQPAVGHEELRAASGTRILNNLVTELLDTEEIPSQADHEFSFTNPRQGWVFISCTATVSDASATVSTSLDTGEEEPLFVHRYGQGETQEAMRLLPGGEYKLRVRAQDNGTASVSKLAVRAVPALMWCGFPASPAVGGDYDFDFLAKDVLANINTIVGEAIEDDPKHQQLQKQWRERGGQWFVEEHIPSISRLAKGADGTPARPDIPDPVTADFLHNWWTSSDTKEKGSALRSRNPYDDGIFQDEFYLTTEDREHLVYGEAFARFAKDKEFENKSLHAFIGGDLYADAMGRELVRAVICAGYKVAWEAYFPEMPTKALAQDYLYGEARREIGRIAQAFPGIMKDMIFVLGFFTTPSLSLNINPAVDFKVWLDMQYNYLANAPECFGMYGLMIYHASLADEETARWAGRLFRHYGIEGKCNLLSDELGFKYIPGHISNPDFDDGLAGWSVSAAEPDSVKAGTMAGLSEMLARYIAPHAGNCYLWTRRSAENPNAISQKITGLVPGKLYSAKLFVADYQDYVQGESVGKTLAVTVDIANVDLVPAKAIVAEIENSERATIGPFKGKNPPWMNYHRIVFRAKAPTANLTILDWADATTPGGPIGQEILCNFVEIQPYLED